MAFPARHARLALAVLALTGVASAQPAPQPMQPMQPMQPGMMPGGMPPGHPPMMAPPGMATPPGRFPQLPGPMPPAPAHGGVDCAVTALTLDAYPRRSTAIIDVSIRVRGVKGGLCVLRPEAIQVTTVKGGGVSKPISIFSLDGKEQKPIAIADTVGNDRLRPWAQQLAAGEEHTISYRQYVEGDLGATGDVDAPSRVRVEMRALGPRVADGAQVKAHFGADKRLRTRASLSMGNPKKPATQHPTNDGVGDYTATFSKEDMLPMLDFKYDSNLPPVVTRATLTDGLSDLEFLRDTVLRDFVASMADSKDDKKIAAGWDAAFDTAMASMRSSDPIVQGFGARTLAWLASGLSTNILTVRGEKATGEGVGVPDKLAAEAEKASAAYNAATGQKYAPAPYGSRSVRSLLAKLGEPIAHRKRGEEALKRLAKRVDDKKVATIAFGDFLGTQPAAPVLPEAAPTTAKIITFGPRGPIFDGEAVAGRGGQTAQRPIAARIVHALTNRMKSRKTLLVVGLFVGAAFALGWFLLEDEKKKGDGQAPAV